MNNQKRPEWLKVKFNTLHKQAFVNELISELELTTVCSEANCPNRWECFSKKTATFMILGSVCTRHCRFCNVTGGLPDRIDSDEPRKVAQAVKDLGLKHAVITSVTRDDLLDGGASQFAEVIEAIKALGEKTIVEVLIPDLQGNQVALHEILKRKPDILNHNMETIKDLYSTVRPEANYERSLALLQNVKRFDPSIHTKSGIMLGLGEKEDEVVALMKDLRAVDVDFLTIGQYLQPTLNHLEIKEYIHPDQFDRYGAIGRELGFKFVASSPLVRSSYNAAECYDAIEHE